MSGGRKRKQSARQQSVGQWRTTSTVLPTRIPDHRAAQRTESVTTTANEPRTASATLGAKARPQAGALVEPLVEPVDDAVTEPVEEEVDDRPPRRLGLRRVVAVALAAPLIFVGAFLAGGWITTQVQDQPPSAALPTIPSSATSSRTETVAPSSPSGSAAFVPGADVGPGLTTAGVLVRATPTADGSLEVVERVRFAEPVDKLSVGPPQTLGVAARSLPRSIEIADLQVQADDAVVNIGAGAFTTPRTLRLPGETSTVVMRYRLVGATVRSIPSTPGRALMVLPPITGPATLGAMPFVIEVSGADVTNVLCPGLPVNAQLCGRTWSQGWYSTPQQAGRTAVLAQLTLPDPVGS